MYRIYFICKIKFAAYVLHVYLNEQAFPVVGLHQTWDCKVCLVNLGFSQRNETYKEELIVDGWRLVKRSRSPFGVQYSEY